MLLRIVLNTPSLLVSFEIFESDYLFIIFIRLEPGKEDCFFLDVPQNSYLELDYQVRLFSPLNSVKCFIIH